MEEDDQLTQIIKDSGQRVTWKSYLSANFTSEDLEELIDLLMGLITYVKFEQDPATALMETIQNDDESAFDLQQIFEILLMPVYKTKTGPESNGLYFDVPIADSKLMTAKLIASWNKRQDYAELLKFFETIFVATMEILGRDQEDTDTAEITPESTVQL